MNLTDVLSLDELFYAHRKPGKETEEKEPLEVHSNLCLSYFRRFVKERQVESALQNLWRCYFSEENTEILSWCMELLEYGILFHDTGKINPDYQKTKMKNPVKVRAYDFLSGANHALLSAVIYMDFCLAQMEKGTFSKQEKQLLKGLISLNGYVISKHHSSLENFQEFCNQFLEGGNAEAIVVGLSEQSMCGYKGLRWLSEENAGKCSKFLKNAMKNSSRKQQICVFTYVRLIYSLLVASDYYATTQYMTGTRIQHFGQLQQAEELKRAYEEAPLAQKIRTYEKEQYGKTDAFSKISSINILRSELFLDVEKAWKENKDAAIYFLEAPTGSGKSNTAMNLSFQMLGEQFKKLFYVYPFNTLIEQNMEILGEVFGEAEPILEKIAVVNSVTPIKRDCETEEDSTEFYQKSLLDRQFLNYPFVLTTNVSLFRTMFGQQRADAFGFMQLAGSVIVLDEIQSYKNSIWSEIIIFLKAFAELLNMKVLIMSATLPDLAYLTGETNGIVRLVKNREKYFSNPKFKERVRLSFELLEEPGPVSWEMLWNHMKKQMACSRKFLVEFISKKSAYAFYRFLQEESPEKTKVFLITGDDNQAERKMILNGIKRELDETIILVATQVIEAGVDIDMDIGYKDISKLDSEEQFLGRINRSCRGAGITFFFDLDAADKIYGQDIRKNHELTLKVQAMREILKEKDFSRYYEPVLKQLKRDWNHSCSEDWSLEIFFNRAVQNLQFSEIQKRMQLIEPNQWTISIFMNRTIILPDGTPLTGSSVWEQYKALLQNQELDYAEKQYKLSQVRSKMVYFVYEVNRNLDFAYNDHVGEQAGGLYYIEDGEQYFESGKLNTEKFAQEGGLFF